MTCVTAASATMESKLAEDDVCILKIVTYDVGSTFLPFLDHGMFFGARRE